MSVSREKNCPSTPRVRGRIRPQRPCIERITEEVASSYLICYVVDDMVFHGGKLRTKLIGFLESEKTYGRRRYRQILSSKSIDTVNCGLCTPSFSKFSRGCCLLFVPRCPVIDRLSTITWRKSTTRLHCHCHRSRSSHE